MKSIIDLMNTIAQIPSVDEATRKRASDIAFGLQMGSALGSIFGYHGLYR